MNIMNGMFGKIAPGLCRLSMGGGIAVKTSNGYKTYDIEKNRLINCDSFVFNIGEEYFFLVPTNKVAPGDIILVNGKPRCVVRAEKDLLTVINYEDSTVESVLPERHMFLGNSYFYGKIVSMFGKSALKGGKGPGKIMQYMMISEMMKDDSGKGGGMSALLPLMLMGKGENPLGTLFDFDDEDDGEEA